VTYSGGTGSATGAMAMAAAAADAGTAEQYAEGDEQSMFPPAVEQRRVDETQQIGRNDPCWCGSGKKFKKCHGA
jgi:preprotein translocase subunit SecA